MAIIGNNNNWLQIIAKNGNKMVMLSIYRELESHFCHFWQYFASKNCQKWQFLLTSKLPKMRNEHTSLDVIES